MYGYGWHVNRVFFFNPFNPPSELVAFSDFVSPTPAEDAARSAAIARLTSIVTALWPGARVAVFGSTATRLHLPSSDVDAVVLGAPPPPAAPTPPPPAGGGRPPPPPPDPRLKLLAAGLLKAGGARGLTLVARARIPLVKYVDSPSSVLMDVSFDVDGGPTAAAAAARRLEGVPPARPLVAFLKTVLHQRGLNEVYSGGLGSHALLVMVLAFLQAHPSRRGGGGGGGRHPSSPPSPLEPNLGALLLDFCDVFGRRLDASVAGVCAGPSGAFYAKAAAGHGRPDRPWALSVRDPDDPSNDLAGGSFHIHRVRSAFEHVGRVLAAPVRPEEASLLARVVRVEGPLAGRAAERHRSRSPSPPPPPPRAKRQRTPPRTEPPRKRARERDAAFEGGGWGAPRPPPPQSARRRASEGEGGRRRAEPPEVRRKHIRFD